MRGSSMEDAFAHHVWATVRLLDACAPLTEQQLATPIVGTYGSTIGTMRHLVGSDVRYLFDITGNEARRIDEDKMSLAELRAAMETDREAWVTLLGNDLEPDDVPSEIYGYGPDVPVEVRLAQALHHGTEHRIQVCTALTTFGIEPPPIDPFTWWRERQLG